MGERKAREARKAQFFFACFAAFAFLVVVAARAQPTGLAELWRTSR